MGIDITDIAFVRFAAPDLDEVEAFYTEFGLSVAARDDETLYLAAGNGRIVHVSHRAADARFVGVGFDAVCSDDLVTLSTQGFSSVEPLPGPQGGHRVTATDPDGFTVEVVADRTPLAAGPQRQTDTHNTARAKHRIGSPLRLDPGASRVERIGHCVLDVSDFRASERWYKEHLGLVTSDEIRIGDEAIGAFLRCGRGADFVDHHTLFLLGTGTPRLNHAAFEVADLDDLMRGHTHLHERERDAQWGVGRHILGSQVYDYWLDPNGFMVEHWTDGDLFNHDTPPSVAGLDELLGSQWGPTHGGPPA